jgi:hypothetical protein
LQGTEVGGCRVADGQGLVDRADHH